MPESLPQLPEALIESEVQAICTRYRVTPLVARQILLENFASHPDLVQKIEASYQTTDVTRLREYKSIIKKTRKQVYYHLRQYSRDKEEEEKLKYQLENLIQRAASFTQITPVLNELLLTHVSTQERVQHYADFYELLFDLISPPQTILDIGCGLHPLSYPYHEAAPPKTYVAVDKAQESIKILELFSSCLTATQLTPICADVAEVEWLTLMDEIQEFDLVFMLKVIPVIYRQHRELLPKLAQVPAKNMLITASTESLTRKEKITGRENRVLREFIDMSGRAVVGTIQIESEFGYLLG